MVSNDTSDQIDLIAIYRIVHPKAAEYTYSSAHGIFSKTDHMLNHKTSLRKLKKIKIIPSIFSEHNTMRLELPIRKKTKNKKHCTKHKHMESKQHATK